MHDSHPMCLLILFHPFPKATQAGDPEILSEKRWVLTSLWEASSNTQVKFTAGTHNTIPAAPELGSGSKGPGQRQSSHGLQMK